MRLQVLREEALVCTKCALHETRTNVVFMSGPEDAKWVFCGEAPGMEEDQSGLPFVGRSGKLLDSILKELGWSRDQVAVINTLQCRPPNNRDPLPGEKEACRPFFEKKIEIIQPVVITALGRHAASSLLGSPVSMGSVRGKVYDFMGAKVVPTYHPSYVLRGAIGAKETLREDLILAISILAENGYGC